MSVVNLDDTEAAAKTRSVLEKEPVNTVSTAGVEK